MIDTALCSQSPSQWLVMKSTISSWLMTPTLVVVPLAGLILLPWMLPLRWKRLLSGVGSLLLVTYFAATLPLTIAVANKGLVAFLPSDPGVTADAIVILGRGQPFRASRVDVAARLWKDQRAPLIFASGAGDGAELSQLLQERGIPKRALADENCSRTTEENALYTASALQSQGVKKILLVTDPPHMLRSLLTFRNLGFDAYPHPSPLPHNLASKKKAMMVFYEYAGLVSYGLKGYLKSPNDNIETSQIAKARATQLDSQLSTDIQLGHA